MSSIPSNLARVPVTLSTQVFLNNLTKSQGRLLNTQMQLATGRRVNRPSDDVVAGSLSSVLDEAIERREQRMRNLEHGRSLLDVADASLGESSDLVLEAKSLAMAMVGLGIDAQTRKNESHVVQSLIDEMMALANHKLGSLYLFGGKQTSIAPMRETTDGIEYLGTRDGMEIHLGSDLHVPVTTGAPDAFGSLSARVEGDRDLNPDLTGNSRVSDLNGARGLDVALGTIRITINGSDDLDVDLADADSVQDVIDLIDDAIATYETDNSATILTGARVDINAAANGLALYADTGNTIDINDLQGSFTAADLGLTDVAFDDTTTDGNDLDPRLSRMTALADLPNLAGLDDFIIANGDTTRVIETSSAQTIGDLIDLIKQADAGVRLELNDDGTRLNLLNQMSGADLAVYETTGGQTALELGIRTQTEDTLLADLNDGRGVSIVTGSTDPETGLPDPSRDVDFSITLSDGTEFEVDLAGAITLGDVVDIVTAAAPATFTIEIDDDAPNGLILTDLSGGADTFKLTPRNSSFAAQDLGISTAADGATITGEDRSTVTVDSVFSHLLALKQALLNNDETGITIAGEKLELDIDRFAKARAVIGQRANRISSMIDREADQQVMDLNLRSEIQDLDYSEASVRFSSLQTQIEAAMITGSQAGQLSLIRFLA
ncbi:MAG: hypothetical protein D8M59_11935 [Planctomycetes bacterium]|nr:hypothetical protein [Planctomycetota bacterium]NOG53513.1 hypothetical protein [Planctomycetota bacterium]